MVQDTPRFPDDRSSDYWHSMQNKTMAFFFNLFLSDVDMDYSGTIKRSRLAFLNCTLLVFCFAFLFFPLPFLVTPAARRDDTTTCCCVL